jgi:DNA-binding SARP family transcriptional activator
MYKVEVLGPFRMTDGEGAPVAFEARTAAAVVALLALAKGHALTRNDVASTLWPDQDEGTARTNLRKAIQRVRKATPEPSPLESDGDLLRLDPQLVETDLEEAERLHRTFLLAAREDEGVEALAEEWTIRRRTLLEGWEAEWIEGYRLQAGLAANDLAMELARSLEAVGDPAGALRVWHELLERVPHHAQALQNALRLELQLRGRDKAAELARTARLVFHQDLGIEMPFELRRTLRDFQTGALEPVPAPDHLRKRSELYLLARMFEANLDDNRTEALAMLARECKLSQALAHPKSMLGVLSLALDRTEGTSPERIQVAALAGTIASWSSQFEIGHRWSDFVLESTTPDNPVHGSVMSMKGFMLFEQREYDAARKTLDRAIEVLREQGREDDAMRAGIARAALYWHLEEFEPAIDIYTRTIEYSMGRTDEIASLMRGSANSNLCFVYVTTQQWEKAVPHGREAIRHADEHPVFGWIVPGSLGLALFCAGSRLEGLRLIARALASTLREGMTRFNQLSLDFAAIALARSGKERVAHCLIHANGLHRVALRHDRSPAERSLIVAATGLDPDKLPSGENPLDGQSAATLSEWACEELERLAQLEEKTAVAAGI